MMTRKFSVFILVLAQGCATQVEDARLELNSHGSSIFNVLISYPSAKESEDSLVPNKLIAWAETAKNCGATTRIYSDGYTERHVLHIQLNTPSFTQLEVAMRCGVSANSWFPNFTINTTDGIFRKTVHLRVEVKREFTIFGSAPDTLQITMPFAISSFEDTSNSKLYFVSAIIEGDRALVKDNRIEMSEKEQDALNKRGELLQNEIMITECEGDEDCAMEKVWERYGEDLSFELLATQLKIGLQDIFAALGVFLGSGLMVEAGRRLGKKWVRKSSG